MAYAHKYLKYHKDDIEKHKITKEEIEFLKNLQREMNTQDHVSQADPRFWVIKGSTRDYGKGDNWEIIHDGDTIAENMEDAFDYLGELLEDSDRKIELELTKNKYIQIVEHTENGKDAECLTDGEDVVDYLEFIGFEDYEIMYYEMTEIIYPNLMFITQKGAENHLLANDYHYSEDAHTYAMTAWRSGEVEKLWDILQKVDFGKLESEGI